MGQLYVGMCWDVNINYYAVINVFTMPHVLSSNEKVKKWKSIKLSTSSFGFLYSVSNLLMNDNCVTKL